MGFGNRFKTVDGCVFQMAPSLAGKLPYIGTNIENQAERILSTHSLDIPEKVCAPGQILRFVYPVTSNILNELLNVYQNNLLTRFAFSKLFKPN